MKHHHLADWQLPTGVDRGLWEYVHSEQIASHYDEELRDTPLLRIDQKFVEKHCQPPRRLIDLGCGTGRALIPQAKKGHWVLGVDLSEAMLRVAGEKAKSAQVAIERLQANLVDLDGIEDESFDYALCLFSTFGMIGGQENRRRVLAHVQRLLKPGGRFILHVHNRWFNFWNRPGRRWLLRDCWRSLCRSPKSGDRVMPAHDGRSSLTLHLFTRREIIRLLREAQFEIVEVRPISLREDGVMFHRWWFGPLRAYGYLIAAAKA